MTPHYKYIFDGQPSTFDELIAKAKEYGMEPSQWGTFSPKYTIKFLSDKGHTIVENE